MDGKICELCATAGGTILWESPTCRVVLVDDDGVRAVMTAHWLKQMGWDVAAMTLDMRTPGTRSGEWMPHVPGLEGALVSRLCMARTVLGSGGRGMQTKSMQRPTPGRATVF